MIILTDHQLFTLNKHDIFTVIVEINFYLCSDILFQYKILFIINESTEIPTLVKKYHSYVRNAVQFFNGHLPTQSILNVNNIHKPFENHIFNDFMYFIMS